MGPQGCPGIQGNVGPVGPLGPTGPQGVPPDPTQGHAYALMPLEGTAPPFYQLLYPVPDPAYPPFPIGPVPPGGTSRVTWDVLHLNDNITHPNPTELQVVNSGKYQITFKVNIISPP
jgi:hypothetical protein